MSAVAPSRYLALGDSYTIGEGVPRMDTWPQQLARRLRADGIAMDSPDVIATTGWSTDELLHELDAAPLQPPYALLTLLIGVNNQYRGRSAGNYRDELATLLQRARALSTGHDACMIVLSIPDWGVTRFALEQGRDSKRIGREIDVFNAIGRDEAGRAGAQFVDITGISRRCAAAANMLVDDGLHPSGAQHALWLAPILAVAAHELHRIARDNTRREVSSTAKP